VGIEALLEGFSAFVADSFVFLFSVSQFGAVGQCSVFAVRAHRHRSEGFSAFVAFLFGVLDQAFHRVVSAVRAERHSLYLVVAIYT
jgi:hypothetical protein